MGVTTNLGKTNSKNQRYVKFLIYQGSNKNRKSYSPNIFLYVNHGSFKLDKNQRNHNKEATVQINYIKSILEKDLYSGTNQFGILHKCHFLSKYEKYTSQKGNFHIYAFKSFSEYLNYKNQNEIEPNKINKFHLSKYIEFLNQEKRLSPRTINSYVNSIICCIRDLNDQGIVNHMPNIKGLKLRIPETQYEILSERELKKLKSIKQKCEVIRSFLFSHYTGLREIDLKKIKYSDVKKVGDGYFLDVIQNKTGNKVKIPLHEYLQEIIDVNKVGSNKKLFDLPTNSTINRRLKKTLASLEIDKFITFRYARRGFAQMLLWNNINIKTISVLLGHKNITTIDNYIYASIDDRKKAINKLN